MNAQEEDSFLDCLDSVNFFCHVPRLFTGIFYEFFSMFSSSLGSWATLWLLHNEVAVINAWRVEI